MWKRNLLFWSLCLIGVAAAAGTLLTGNRLTAPRLFGGQTALKPDAVATVARVDAEFQASWQKEELTPAPRADDFTIARRLSLALTGMIPSLEEVRALEAVPEEQRVDWWVDHLLSDRRYADYFGERLARAYVGTENGPFLAYRRRRFVTWLSDRLHANDPYDKIVRDLIADTGLWTGDPAVNFVTVTIDQNKEGSPPDPARLAGRTTRAFLGMRIDCPQCHDDRLGNVELGTPDDPRGGTQRDFHGLAAYFGQTQSSPFGVSDDEDKVYRVKFLGETEEEVVPPLPPFDVELAESEGTRREQLAHWITSPENKPFARATVNRVWALMCGRPLVDPVDDIPLYGPFPPGLEALADDFSSHGYDVKRLIRIIAATEAFQRDSRSEGEVTPLHERRWAVFPVTRLRPEQVAGSLIQASSLRTIDADSNIVSKLLRFAQQGGFVNRYGDRGEEELIDESGTATQRLLMMNGDLVAERTKADGLTAAQKIAVLSPDDETAVETAYLTLLSRQPSDREKQHFVERLRGTTGPQRGDAMEDLYWVLVNSTEFSWNH